MDIHSMLINNHRKEVYGIIICFIILFLLPKISYSAAWTKEEGKMFNMLEFYAESTDISTFFKNKNSNFYKTDYYKIYFEYGLLSKITFGGYLKKYSFYSKYYGDDGDIVNNINNDYYSSIFLVQNLYKTNNNSASLKYSLYFPIKYSNLSKIINPIDIKIGYELSLSFGRSNTIFNYFKYYFDIMASYKIVQNINNDEFNFNITLGIASNKTSSFDIQYEYKNYPSSLLSNKNISYNYYLAKNINKIRLSNKYKFSDNYLIELSYYKIFSTNNSDAFSISIIFDY